MTGPHYLWPMQVTVGMIASLVGGTIEGDAGLEITGPARIEEGKPGTISFLADSKYEAHAYSTGASALLVHTDFAPRRPINATLIRVADVRAAVARLLTHFEGKGPAQQGISPQAWVDPSARIGEGSSVGRFSVVEKGAVIGKGVIIHDQVYVGQGAVVGEGSVLWPGVRILRDCLVGSHCHIHANTVIGADGFGYAPQEDGTYTRIPQVGRVRLEDRVDIGANCTIDRATMGETVIEEGVKIDNLVHIAHNVRVGAHTAMAAQAGIAGSTRIGAHCQVGGQVGISGHLEIADHTRIQAQSGVAGDVEEAGQALFGSPAIGYKSYVRAYAVFKQLPDVDKRLRRLEQMLDD